MPRRLILAALCLLAGCAGDGARVVTPAQLRPGELVSGGGDPDMAALELAQRAFADPSRTYGRPADAARAAAALDYLAGQLDSPRWTTISAGVKQALLQGRDEVRSALGVVSGTPSQVVVDRLAEAAAALDAGDQAAAVRDLGGPAFNEPGTQVLARLSELPYMRMANVATTQAAEEFLGSNNQD